MSLGTSGGTPTPVTSLDEESIISAIEKIANKYETSLTELFNDAASGNFGIADATSNTTRVQMHQAITELLSGVTKNLTDYLKGLARKIT